MNSIFTHLMMKGVQLSSLILQETLQEERISKLEADLESVETQLQLKEEELEKWKKHALCLSELSLTSTPGTLLGPQGIYILSNTVCR
jgi:hypothetical protein